MVRAWSYTGTVAARSRLKRFNSSGGTRDESEADQSFNASRIYDQADGTVGSPRSPTAVILTEEPSPRAGGSQHREIIVSLTQAFGETTAESVEKLLQGQQDQMCDDIVGALKQKMEELMGSPEYADDAFKIATLIGDVLANVKKAVDSTRTINTSVSKRALNTLVDEIALDHVGHLQQFASVHSEEVESKAEVAEIQAKAKQERQANALKAHMTEQASLRGNSFKDRLKEMEDSIPVLEESLADWTSRTEVAEKILTTRQNAARSQMDLLEAEQATMTDRKAALIKQLRNEKVKAERVDEQLAEAQAKSKKVQMRRAVVQGQLDMVKKINQKALDDDAAEGIVSTPLKGRGVAGGKVRPMLVQQPPPPLPPPPQRQQQQQQQQ